MLCELLYVYAACGRVRVAVPHLNSSATANSVRELLQGGGLIGSQMHHYTAPDRFSLRQRSLCWQSVPVPSPRRTGPPPPWLWLVVDHQDARENAAVALYCHPRRIPDERNM